MKKTLITIALLTSLLTAKTVTINKGSDYEAIVTSKGESLYVTQKGKKQKIYTREEELSDEENNNLEFQIDDINFDGVDDIAIFEFTAQSGVNLYYQIFLAENGSYKKSKLSLSNYKLYPSYRTILSEYKDGPRHFTDLYSVDVEGKAHRFVNYENYRGDDLCFIKKLELESPREVGKTNGVLSCKALLKKHEAVKLYAKVIKKKALLYNRDGDEKSNGMYVIKNDMVELIGGTAESDKVLVRFRGKRVVTKYIKVEDLKVVPRKRYEHKHRVVYYDNGKRIEEKTNDSLTIQKVGSKKYHFILDTIGTNLHTCDMEGIAQDKGKYLLFREDTCRLKLHKIKGGFKSEDKDMKCKENGYCGHHGFVGGFSFQEIE